MWQHLCGIYFVGGEFGKSEVSGFDLNMTHNCRIQAREVKRGGEECVNRFREGEWGTDGVESSMIYL